MIRKNISKEHEENTQMKSQLPNNKATKSSNQIEVDNTQENQTVKENEKMQEENNVVEEVKNEEQINGDLKIVLESPFKTMEEKYTSEKLQEEGSGDPTFGTGILGGVRPVKGKKSSTGKTRKNGYAEEIRQYIAKHYSASDVFVTANLSKHFKNKHNLKDSDVSGQLYGLRKAGWVENRKPNEEEKKTTGNGIRIWKGTEKLYKAYADDLKVAESTEDYEVNKEDE